eukprot:TRINITY_DN2563_c0_g1_i2.p1 TRINITY_DN2563_c0_g1~~TRINITY_DN2563_c0_g1_i2.p1  ORF type:complete len:358 (-),score=60.30 TRINITY_DN2563_c0_g1_i2:56-1129(-)
MCIRDRTSRMSGRVAGTAYLVSLCFICPARALPHAHVQANSHWEVGFKVGQAFKGMIQDRFSRFAPLHEDLVPFAATPDGQNALNSLLSAASALYPEYLQELNGTAVGAQVDFKRALLMNFRDELLPLSRPKGFHGDSSCSDYSVVDHKRNLAVVAHNEDGADCYNNHTYLVTVQMGGTEFTAYTYAGELPSTAFGWNSHGVGFTLNAMHPNTTVLTGIGRNFVARSILDAKTIEEAVELATIPNQATGHNYQLFVADTEPKVFSIETYPPNASHITSLSQEDTQTSLFHTNCYLFLHDPDSHTSLQSAQQWQCIDPNKDSQGRLTAAQHHAVPVSISQSLHAVSYTHLTLPTKRIV